MRRILRLLEDLSMLLEHDWRDVWKELSAEEIAGQMKKHYLPVIEDWMEAVEERVRQAYEEEVRKELGPSDVHVWKYGPELSNDLRRKLFRWGNWDYETDKFSGGYSFLPGRTAGAYTYPYLRVGFKTDVDEFVIPRGDVEEVNDHDHLWDDEPDDDGVERAATDAVSTFYIKFRPLVFYKEGTVQAIKVVLVEEIQASYLSHVARSDAIYAFAGLNNAIKELKDHGVAVLLATSLAVKPNQERGDDVQQSELYEKFIADLGLTKMKSSEVTGFVKALGSPKTTASYRDFYWNAEAIRPILPTQGPPTADTKKIRRRTPMLEEALVIPKYLDRLFGFDRNAVYHTRGSLLELDMQLVPIFRSGELSGSLIRLIDELEQDIIILVKQWELPKNWHWGGRGSLDVTAVLDPAPLCDKVIKDSEHRFLAVHKRRGKA